MIAHPTHEELPTCRFNSLRYQVPWDRETDQFIYEKKFHKFHVDKDGNLSSLFRNKGYIYPIGVWIEAQYCAADDPCYSSTKRNRMGFTVVDNPNDWPTKRKGQWYAVEAVCTRDNRAFYMRILHPHSPYILHLSA